MVTAWNSSGTTCSPLFNSCITFVGSIRYNTSVALWWSSRTELKRRLSIIILLSGITILLLLLAFLIFVELVGSWSWSWRLWRCLLDDLLLLLLVFLEWLLDVSEHVLDNKSDDLIPLPFGTFCLLLYLL
jgi:hypothetical protein